MEKTKAEINRRDTWVICTLVPSVFLLLVLYGVLGWDCFVEALTGQTAAAWVQAIGSVAAIYWAARMARWQRADERGHEAERAYAAARVAALVGSQNAADTVKCLLKLSAEFPADPRPFIMDFPTLIAMLKGLPRPTEWELAALANWDGASARDVVITGSQISRLEVELDELLAFMHNNGRVEPTMAKRIHGSIKIAVHFHEQLGRKLMTLSEG